MDKQKPFKINEDGIDSMWCSMNVLVDESIDTFFSKLQIASCGICGEPHSFQLIPECSFHNGEDVLIDCKPFHYVDSGDFYHKAKAKCCKHGKVTIETRYHDNEGNHKVVLICFKRTKT